MEVTEFYFYSMMEVLDWYKSCPWQATSIAIVVKCDLNNGKSVQPNIVLTRIEFAIKHCFTNISMMASMYSLVSFFQES